VISGFATWSLIGDDCEIVGSLVVRKVCSIFQKRIVAPKIVIQNQAEGIDRRDILMEFLLGFPW
jgi:hypothetical protein